MRHLKIALFAVTAASAMAGDGVATRRFSTFEQFQPFFRGGMEFTARGDTEDLTVTRAVPAESSAVKFPIWNNGVPHAFKIVHNANGITALEIDDIYSFVSPVAIGPRTNGLLITSTAAAGGSIRLSNLKLSRSPFDIKNINAISEVPPKELLLVKTTSPLSTFILSGQATFTWSGALPLPEEQWFELTPVVVCEPCDVNCDGSVNPFDIQPFVDVLKFGAVEPCSECMADTNLNGTINQFDIQGFVECLGG